MRHRLLIAGGMAAMSATIMACGGSDAAVSPTNPTSPIATGTTAATTPATSPAPTTAGVQAMYAQFGNGVVVSYDGSTVVLQTTDVPDHPSPYFGAGHAQYEPPHSGMQPNSNRIVAQNLTFRVPAAPSIGSASDTPLGPIGISVNGVVFFNQYAAMRQPLMSEIVSFDRHNGHPTPANQYHYHFEPLSITASSRSRLIGVLLDGFPVYGPVDADGRAPGDLDSCNGHVSATAEFGAGIYHYHTTTAVPYISGCFRGTPGTVR